MFDFARTASRESNDERSCFMTASSEFRHDTLYTVSPPWDIGHPQPALKALAEQGLLRGRVLDVGCGTGEHALMAAALGLEATGIDLAGNALSTAEQKARTRGLTARFLKYDALKLAELGEVFDTVLDCGLFHVFSDGERAPFIDGLRVVLSPGGRYFHLGFSDRETGSWEPNRQTGTWDHHPDTRTPEHHRAPGDREHRPPRKLTEGEIRATFTDGWRIDSIEPASIEIAVDPGGVRAWLVSATRI